MTAPRVTAAELDAWGDPDAIPYLDQPVVIDRLIAEVRALTKERDEARAAWGIGGVKEQAAIDKARREMAAEIVNAQNPQTLEAAREFAQRWIETASQHAANEEYFRKERDLAEAKLAVAVEALRKIDRWESSDALRGIEGMKGE